MLSKLMAAPPRGMAAYTSATLEPRRSAALLSAVSATKIGKAPPRPNPVNKRAQMSADEIKQNAQAEAARIIAQAKAEAEQQTVRARESLRDQVAVLAVKGAEQILKREVNAQVHADLLNQLKAEL